MPKHVRAIIHILHIKFHCCNLDAKRCVLVFGSSRLMMKSLSSPCVIVWWEEFVLGPFFVLIPYLTAKIQVICLFYSLNNRTIPWGICHFSANIAEVNRVIYALLGYSYKYTIQSITVECQLKLSRHNSHERTWEHHLQYNRFRTTPNRNWEELRGNNFPDHVTNTCSDDSRSCDFIVVWENNGARVERCHLLKTGT
jgi:hypothetical protein